MPRPAPFAVVLILLLIFSLIFLGSFSYDDFFHIKFLLGFKTYLILVFLVVYLSEFIFNALRKKETGTSYIGHAFVFTFPLLFTAILIGLLFILFSVADTPSSGGHGSVGLFLLYYVSIGGFLYSVVRIVIFILRSKNQADLITLFFNNLNSLLNKSYKYLLPVLIISSISIFSLAYTDFKSGGIKYKFSKESNHVAMSKKAITQNDLSFCNNVAHQYESYRKQCFELFFKNNSETQSVAPLVKKNPNEPKSEPTEFLFFTNYKQLEQKHCSKSKYYEYCTAAIFSNLYPILKSETGESLHSVNWSFSYQTSIDMIIISIHQGLGTFKETNIRDVKKYNNFLDRQKNLANKMSKMNAVIKTVNKEYPRTREKSLNTEIHIDFNKLLKNDKDYTNIINGIKEVFKVKPIDSYLMGMKPNSIIKARKAVLCKRAPSDPPSLLTPFCYKEETMKFSEYCKNKSYSDDPRCVKPKPLRYQYNH